MLIPVERRWEANSLHSLQVAFTEASQFLNDGEGLRKARITVRDEAEVIMTDIFSLKGVHKGASITAGATMGGGTFMGVATITAPFLGPFCVLAGAVAAAFTATGTTAASRSLTLGSLDEKHSKKFVDNACQYVREGQSSYSLEVDRSPYPDGPSIGH